MHALRPTDATAADATRVRRARLRAAQRPAWKSIAVRALATMLVGASALTVPDLSAAVLLALLAGYALVSAGTTLAVARFAMRARERAWPLVVYALLAAGFAVVVVWWPLMTPFAVTTLFVLWVLSAAAAELALGVWLRGLVPHAWLLAAAGVSSIVVFALLLREPARAVELAARLAGGYAVLSGIFLSELAVRLRRGEPGTASASRAAARRVAYRAPSGSSPARPRSPA